MIRDWTIVQAGNYPSSNFSEYAGDTQIFPDVVSLTPSPGIITNEHTWLQHNASNDNYIELTGISWPLSTDYSVWYAVSYINSPSDRSANLKTDQDDALRIWVNGAIVANYIGLDEHTTNINLVKGINTILIRVVNGGGPTGYYVSIVDPSTNNEYSDLTYYTTKPEEVTVTENGEVVTTNEDEETATTIASDLVSLGSSLPFGYEWAISSDGTVVLQEKDVSASTPSSPTEKWYNSMWVKVVIMLISLIVLYTLYRRGNISWL